MTKRHKSPDTRENAGGFRAPAAGAEDVKAFLEQVRRTPPARSARDHGRGRLIFSMDATMSRQPTWDRAQHLQAEMFRATAELGGLDVQLVYYRGFSECKASRWVAEPRRLADLMTRIDCRGGYTQIGRVLKHIRKAALAGRVDAAVHVGDACEEDIDTLAHLAGEVALAGVPVFMFQEGEDPAAHRAFAEIARITKGAHVRFDEGAARQLEYLLRGVAIYASGGRGALEKLAHGEEGARLLLSHLRREQ